jgi:hypothetical protein
MENGKGLLLSESKCKKLGSYHYTIRSKNPNKLKNPIVDP